MKMFAISAVLALVAGSASAASTLVSWNSTGMAGNEASMPVSFTAANVTAAAMTRGAGLGGNAGANSFNSNGWADLAANDYVELSFTIAAGYAADLDIFALGSQSSGTGPGTMGVYSSTNGFASPVFTITQGAATNVNTNGDVSALTGLTGSVTLRFKAVNGTSANGGSISANGTWRIWDQNLGGGTFVDSNITGDIYLVPAPGAFALAGLGGLAMARRRR
jgi:uncharacterized protein (TIGR03382 family)